MSRVPRINVDASPGSSNTEKSFNCHELFAGKEENSEAHSYLHVSFKSAV